MRQTIPRSPERARAGLWQTCLTLNLHPQTGTESYRLAHTKAQAERAAAS
ncbi:hypothetical protein GCM10010350_72450 [Streptomyces galilaeus]|nr:hypothetical protein GCM10010350_72450 [Streptomyces galilaeus]